MTSDQALYSLVSAVIVALLALAGAWLKSKNDAKASSGDHALKMIENLQVQHDKLKEEFAEVRDAYEEMRRINQELYGEPHDEKELNKDLIEFVKIVREWIRKGALPPHPVASWRIRAILDKAENSGKDVMDNERDTSPPVMKDGPQ